MYPQCTSLRGLQHNESIICRLLSVLHITLVSPFEIESFICPQKIIVIYKNIFVAGKANISFLRWEYYRVLVIHSGAGEDFESSRETSSVMIENIMTYD